jgi:hypothetical protein
MKPGGLGVRHIHDTTDLLPFLTGSSRLLGLLSVMDRTTGYSRDGSLVLSAGLSFAPDATGTRCSIEAVREERPCEWWALR